MNYKKIDGASVSSVILGTDYYGSTVSKNDCFKLYDMYVENGGNHIDTAHLYVGGESERILGEWLKGKSRDGLYIATKGAHPPLDNMNASRLTRTDIRADLEESLKNLSLDYVDLYWLHRDNPVADIAEVMETLNELIKEGKIRSIGCSNWTGERIKQANEYAKNHGLKGFCASQIKWSLARTSPSYADDPTLVEMNASEFEFYKESQIPVIAFASQGKGFFSKVYNSGVDSLSDKAKERYLCEDNLRRYEAVKQLAQKYNTSVGAIAVAWIASQTDVCAMPIIGCKNKAQLTDSLKSADLVLTQEEIEFCM